MKLKRTLIISFEVICGILAFSCQKSPNNSKLTALTFTTISQSKLSEFIEEIDYIILDHPNTSISQVDKVIVSGSNIFLADIYGFQNIARYNNNGKYLNSIGSYGEGPGEFTQYSDLTINKDGESLFILTKGKLMEYEITGEFRKEKKLAENPYKFISLDQDKFCFYYPEAMNFRLNSRTGNSILVEVDFSMSSEVGLLSGVFPKQFNFMGEKNNLFRYRESLLFSTSFSDTIYFFTENQLNKKIALDFGKYKVDMETLYNLPIHELIQKVNSPSYLLMKIHFPNIFYNGRILVSSIRHNNKVDFWAYDNLNEKIFMNSKLSNDLDGGPDLGVIKWVDDQYIYSFFQPEELFKLISEKGDGISGNFRTLSKRLSRNDFLVLAKYSLKR